MSKLRILGAVGLGASVLVLCLVLALEFLPSPPPARADAIVSYQTVTVYDGTAVYTDTQYSTAYVGAGFAHLQIQAAQSTVTTTEIVTYTPQFSLEPVNCALVTSWFDAGSWSDNTKTGLILPVAATASDGREVPVEGRCIRIKVTPKTSEGYTPTLYLRMLNK